jgi:heme-degrading monooxygenase HmoA
MILVTFWESKVAHERSHLDPEFKSVFESLGEHLVQMPVEEFYEVLK